MIAARVMGGAALAARLDVMPRAIAANLAREATRLGDALRARVERNLSGAVLQQRSGRLAGSIGVAVDTAGGAVGVTLGSDAPYAAIHEYGGRIPARTVLPKSARTLAFTWQGRERFFRRVEIPPVQMPERSFLRSALAEMAPGIRAGLAVAVTRSVSS
ncbi:MAG: phage virion morphogenesis protein [Stellaceae bacterium]